MKATFVHYDANKDGRISRQEFQAIINEMTASGESLTAHGGVHFDRRQFDYDFADRDKNHDGYLNFDEFTQGACKHGYLDPAFPPLPKR